METYNMVTRRSLLKSGMVAGALTAGSVTSGSAQDGALIESFVERSGTELHVDGETWYFNGTNNYSFASQECCYIQEDWMRRYAELGFNAVRTWAFLVGPQGGRSFQPEPGVYNEEALDTLDYTVYQAKRHGIRLVVPFVDNWPWFGGMDQYVEWSDTADKHDDFYTDEQCRQWYKQWVEYLLTRENNYTGIEYRNEPTIAIWELANEPRAQQAGEDVLHEWLVEMSAHLKRIDDNHLVSTGMEGFYSREHADGGIYGGADGTDYLRHHRIDDIDVCTFHAYPGHWAKSDEWITEWIEDHVREAHEILGKPTYCGEFSKESEDVTNPFERRERNETMEQWYHTMAELETNGALVWQVIDDDWVSKKGPDISFEHQGTLDVIDSFTLTQQERSGRPIESVDSDDGPDRFVHDCSDLDALHERSDLDSLRVDTTNPEYFDRSTGPDADGGRIARAGTTKTRSLVYEPGGLISGFTVEGHHHQWNGCEFAFHVSTDGGDTWEQVPVSAAPFADVEATWHSVEYASGVVPAGADRLRIDITGGDHDWDGQVGTVSILLGGEEKPAWTTDRETLVDGCSDFSALQESSDLDSLRVDTSNSEYFDRNDETASHDGARITRDGTTDTRSLVYAPEGIITEFTVESHYQEWERGEVAFYASTDGGDSWTEVSVSGTEYGEPRAGWHSVEYESDSLPFRADRIRIDLAGGNAAWANQIGHVRLSVDPIAEEFVEGAFLDDCTNLDALAPESDLDRLTVDAGDSVLAEEGGDTAANARITRDGTTETASLFYRPGGELQQARIEAYNQRRNGGQLKFYASTDGGDTWRQLWPAETSYDASSVADGWESTSYKALWMPAGTDTFRIDVCCGSTPDAYQIGQVEIDASGQ